MERFSTRRVAWRFAVVVSCLTSIASFVLPGDFERVDAAALAFTKRVIESSKGGDVKIVADIDGDGQKDLIVGGSPGENLVWYRYPSWSKTTIAVANIEFTTDGDAGDVDGDGDIDIVVPDGYGTNRLYWFENPLVRSGGPGNPFDTAQWTRRILGSLSSWGKDIKLSDFDGNSLMDVAARTAGEYMVFFQTSPSVWSRQLIASAPGGEGMSIGDVDRDGDADLIVEDAWLQNPGGAAARNPSSWTRFNIGPMPAEFKAFVANIDGDPANEILISCSEGTDHVVWWDPDNGDPTGSWTSHLIAPWMDRAHTLQAGDMDNDGDMDVVIGQMHTSSEKELAVYLNVGGAGQTWQKYVVDQGTGLHNGVVADIGQDGDLDIFGANWTGNGPIALWENLAGPAAGDVVAPSVPGNVSATPQSSSRILLSWTPSTDNVAVSGYRVFRDGAAIATSTATSYTNSGLAAATTYQYTVTAFDAAGNESAQSLAVWATTPAEANQAPAANAGQDQTIALPNAASLIGTASDDGRPNPPAAITVNWTKVSGPGTVNFSAPNGLSTTASFSVAGTYVLRLSVSDSALITTDDVAIIASAAGGPPPVSGLVAHWRLDEGGGSTAGDAAGSYAGTLANGAQWTNGQIAGGVGLDGVDDYIALPGFDVAGSALTIAAWVRSTTFSSSVDQRFVSKAAGTAEQDHYWMLGQTMVAGESRLRLRLKTNGNTTTLLAASGNLPVGTWYHAAATYDGAIMRLYVNGVEVGSLVKTGAVATSSAVPVNIGRNPDGSNHMHGVIDDVRIYNRGLSSAEIAAVMSGSGSSANQAPVVNAGTDQGITLPSSATLNGTASDDGQPTPAAMTLSWTSTNGPGAVTFSAPSSAATNATFSTAGTYTLRLTASDGELSGADELTVTVAGAANQAPTVNAGTDQSITLPAAATLAGSVSDDGQPAPPGAVTISWTRVSGPGTVTFSAPNAATTNASFSAAGTYVVRLTGSDGALSRSDDATVTVSSTPASSPGLIAHYRFDEGAGTSAGDAAGAYPGTLVNGATWVAGRDAGGVALDGTDDYIALPDINTAGTGLTISAWVRSSNFSPLVDQRFVSRATGISEQAHDWMLGQISNGANRLRFRLKTNGTTTTLIASTGDLPLNTWYHATATYDGTRMRLYLNGVEVGFVAKTGSVAATANAPLNLGRNPDGSSYMHGALDDVRIYNRALTSAEIAALVSASE
jgi:chitodextrinase